MKPFEEEKQKEVRKKLSDKKGFSFDEKLHRYLLDGRELVSGTTIIARYKKPFNKYMVSEMVATSNMKKKKSFLKNGNDVRKYWELNGSRASNIGTAGHQYCEMFALDPLGTKPSSNLEVNATALMKAIMSKYNIIETEVSRGNRTYMIGYTIDVVLQDKVTGEYVIGDFKFTKNFTAEQYKEDKGNYPNYLLPPFRELKLRDCAYDSGKLQLNLYRKLFEEDTGIDISYCILMHIDGANLVNRYKKGYKVYLVDDLQEQISGILKPVKQGVSALMSGL